MMTIGKKFKKMSRLIIFRSSDDSQIFKLKDHIVDICRSHTIIYSKDLFTKFRIFDNAVNYDIDKNRIRVNFSSGAYLLIKP